MAEQAGITWSGDLSSNAKSFGSKLNNTVNVYMQAQAPRVQDYMRGNAPWNDQTGNARNGLFAKHNRPSEEKFVITAYHTMPYGIWLEVRFAGANRIIFPTVLNEGKRIMNGLRGILGKMGLV